MIISIEGQLTAATPLRATVEVNGFGYEVHVPVTTAEKLPPAGARVKLHTVVIYREDAQTLYGFSTEEERDFFRLLVEHVTGVGPKMAIGIMSRMSLPLLEAAIREGDVASLSKCPGIGRKTAERLVVELRSKVGSTTPCASPAGLGGGADAARPAGGNRHRDAVLALAALGYKTDAADEAIRRALLALGQDATTEQLIKKALGSG